MAYTLRPATSADAATVAELFRQSFRDTFGGNYPPHELEEFLARSDAALYARVLADPENRLLVGEQDGVMTGFCLLGPQAELPVDSSRRWWVLRQLYLLEAAKGRGMAQAMLDWAIAESRGRGMEELYLTVWIDNPRARRLYEKYGFVECGTYPYRVGSVIDDDRIMRLEL